MHSVRYPFKLMNDNDSDTSTSTYSHQTVLLHEAVEALAIKEDGCYIDGTYGRGGHSANVLAGLGEKGRLIVIDKDPEAIADAQETYKNDHRVFVWQGSFSRFADALAAAGINNGADGMLLDLGVSSPQLDDAERGFSFMREGALDMRMNPATGISAAEWVRNTSEKEIATALWQYGEERFSRRIARKIVEFRAEEPIETTTQLANLIALAVPKREPGKNPATRSFQAIRIVVNKELDDLQDCLQASLEHLSVNGRIVVISFHSLEDRIVKRFLQLQKRGPKLPRGLPVLNDYYQPKMKTIGKAIKPSIEEISENKRSRSAIMRIGERVA